MKGLEYDKLTHEFKKMSLSAWHVFYAALKVILVSISFTVIGYGVIALCYNTRTERRLKAETERMDSLYRALKPQELLVGDVITGLQLKDAYIYEQMFHSEAPNVDPVGNLDFLFASDSIPDSKLISYTSAKADELSARVSRVDAAFEKIFSLVSSEGFVLPPMTLPLKNISYSQVGASVGDRIQPFTKTLMHHEGLDLIAPQGDTVFSPAAGVVSLVSRSSKGQGNLVEISHPGGYVTRYEHLSDIFVKQGQRVPKGSEIASVGMSGSSFAPHLHYEVMHGSEFLDPVNFIFASVNPEEYSNMLFMAANTRQSMD